MGMRFKPAVGAAVDQLAMNSVYRQAAAPKQRPECMDGVDTGGEMNNDQRGVDCRSMAEPLWVKVRPEWIERELVRRSCLDMLMSRFGIDAAMVSVPQLAKVLGMSKSTIYASVKAGTFFIPHRLLGSSPMFAIDDVVTWYLTGHVGLQPKPVSGRGEGHAAIRRGRRDENGGNHESIEAQNKHQRDRAVDDLVARALMSMGASKNANG
jgi:predicted DNA-binding transcriptional regulator AlpA